MEPTSAPAAVAPARSQGGRKPVAVLVLGIIGLVTGFTAVTLLCAVIAITLASLAFQEESEGRGDPQRHGLAVAGMVCGIVALCIWIPVVIAVAISEA
jgi:tellurite resistance protein TehA-like permease